MAQTSPTDRGMCCTFNLAAAEDMFKASPFSEQVSKLQKRDYGMSFDAKYHERYMMRFGQSD